jgi:hypothetical protein
MGRVVAQRVQKLDLGVRQFDEDHRHAVVRLVLRRADLGAQRRRDTARRASRSGTAMATWFRRPIMRFMGCAAACAFTCC